SFVPHKEGRFLLPVLAVLCGLAAIGLDELGRLAGPFVRRTAMAAVLVAITLSVVHLPDLTYADVGQSGFPQAESAYGRGAQATRLLLKAHTVPDLCGLRIEGITWVFTGGYTWLHRQVPLENPDSNFHNPGVFNYVISPAGRVTDGTVVARDNGWALTRLPGEGCPSGPPAWSKPTSVTY
ncbi:MAG TPA: hypothetical protein VKA30_11450, partial [Actinomycetota bacterium]|nr:hypothetical protein [Actinomycetota bacterium]